MLIFRPSIAILKPTTLNVPQAPMRNHARKEQGIEPRKWTLESRDKAPVERKVQVTGIVNFASQSIPSIDKDGALRGFDFLRMFGKGLPRQLWESLAENFCPTLPLTEAVLLAVGSVPDPVDEEVSDKKSCEGIGVPAVSVGVVVGEVDCAVAVAERNTSEVPEDKHEAPFFVVHVPVSELEF